MRAWIFRRFIAPNIRVYICDTEKGIAMYMPGEVWIVWKDRRRS